MIEGEPRLIAPGELGVNISQIGTLTKEGSTPSSMIRDKRGRILWKTADNNPEANLRLGTHNIRCLVLSEVLELANIPRDGQGLVGVSQRPFVESLILDRAKASLVLRQVISGNNYVSYPTGYSQFRSSLIFAIAVSFTEWGLFEEVLKRFDEQTKQLQVARQRLEQDVPDVIKLVDDTTEMVVHPVGQRVGKEVLIGLAKGKMSPAEALPIYVTDLRRRKSNPSGTLYLGKDVSGITLDSEVMKVYEKNGAVLFVPKEDKKFGYKWIDIYAVDKENKVDINNRSGSLRIRVGTGKIESQGWYGPELQAFLDYITMNLILEDPSMLLPFAIRRIKGGNLYIGRVGERNITTPFHEKTSAEKLLIIPKYKRKFGYFWIDGYEYDDPIKAKPCFTRRVLFGEGFGEDVRIVDWKGPEIQSVIDWIYGKIPTSMMEAVQIQIDSDIKYSNIYLGIPSLMLQLGGNANFDKSQVAYLIAREKGLYKWLEIQQDNIDLGKRRIVSKLLLETSSGIPKLIGGWIGPEKQALVDYIDGKVDANQLEKINATLNSNKIAHIVDHKGEELTVALRTVVFKEGDVVTLMPLVDDSGNLVLEITKTDNPGAILARSIYDKDENRFRTTSLEAALSQSRKPLNYWTPEKIRETAIQLRDQYGDLTTDLIRGEMSIFIAAVATKYPGGWIQLRRDIGMIQADRSGTYVDQSGKVWAPLIVVVKAAHVDFGTAGRILAKSHPEQKEGRGFNGKKVKFYDLKGALEIIKVYNDDKSKQSPTRSEQSLITPEAIVPEEELLKEYEEILLSGQIMSYEEFMNMKEKQV